MRRRLAILTEIISPYRIPVFNALAKRGDIDLHVIFLAETDPSVREWRVYKDEIQFCYEVLPSFRRRLLRYNVLLNWNLKRALRRADPQVVLCGGYSYIASWQAGCWARRHELPLLLWIESNAHDQRRRYVLIEYVKRRFLNRCDGFVVPGRASADYLKSFRIPEEVIFTAPNAVDTQFFACKSAAVRKEQVQAAHKLPGRFFLYVGRLVPEKGVFDLLQAYATLAPKLRAEMGLVFVGSGITEDELKARARCIDPGCIRFPGFVHREELADFYALADILVFPTHTDPWGLVVNEAMACGLPVISTSVAGCCTDLVIDGWNGRVVPPRDVSQLAYAMQSLACDGELRLKMGEHSKKRICAYSPEACADGLARAALSAGDSYRG
ncbi:MAG TPA: glycosyltransferase family 4 protein [Terriglobales bacterium]|nr:glycosyltransferase family 4 protein [Terriglobales bacterium]